MSIRGYLESTVNSSLRSLQSSCCKCCSLNQINESFLKYKSDSYQLKYCYAIPNSNQMTHPKTIPIREKYIRIKWKVNKQQTVEKRCLPNRAKNLTRHSTVHDIRKVTIKALVVSELGAEIDLFSHQLPTRCPQTRCCNR